MKFTIQPWFARGTMLLVCCSALGEQFFWKESGPGLAMTIVTNPGVATHTEVKEDGISLELTLVTNAGPVIYSVVRAELSRFDKDFTMTTTLASNLVVGVETLSKQIAALPKELGTPVAAINGDFFMMSGAAKGDPRGLHILRGELVSVPGGPSAFWQDPRGKLHAERVNSRLQVTWPDGSSNLAGLNEQLGTNAMVLFTPRMGTLNRDHAVTNSRPAIAYRPPPSQGTNLRTASRALLGGATTNSGFRAPTPGPIRPPGGIEWSLEPAGPGPWLPLRIGERYHAIARESFNGFTNVPDNMMLMSLSSNLVQERTGLTNGTPVTITVATDPDLTGVQTGLGSGPTLVHAGKLHEVDALMSRMLHPRTALGWNEKHIYLAVADGRQPGISVGITLPEMAEFMLKLGCEEVFDLDGGQSATLILNGAIINHPCQGAKGLITPGHESDVANGIVILRRRTGEEE